LPFRVIFFFGCRTAGSYSGGNKRKLSLGVALLGNPAVIFLDEPSTGMDPLARRYMWDLISSISNSIDTSIVLTTHSMEECEALCNRVAIMVNGRFRCLGSSQHLKSRFGGGYSLEIKISISASKQAVTEITNFVARAMPGSKYEDDATSNKVKFSLKREDDGGLPLSRLFELLEEAKKTLAIEAFSISQNTLEVIPVHMVFVLDQPTFIHLLFCSKFLLTSAKIRKPIPAILQTWRTVV
jgi:ABC-type multidrug transport system ATPase subunit